jgi:hypothetical protein
MDVQQIIEMLKAMQEKADTDRKAYREQLQDRMKAYREDPKSDQAKMIAAFKEKTDAWIANIKDAQKRRPPAKK